jgi:hypothetical protein
MNTNRTYRSFTIEQDETSFVIREKEGLTTHPMNWLLRDGTSREGAWIAAQSQAKPVTVILLDGSIKELGVVFNPVEFEKACYRGYVSYGHSMSDGYYAPIRFESWVNSFRRDPAGELKWNNDTSDWVKAALPLYLEAQAA